VALCVPVFTPSYAGSEAKLEARLVWGTNGEKPNDPKLKELNHAIKDKLVGIFKWKNYYEVNLEKIAVNTDAPKAVTMSPKCKIEVQNFGDSTFDVKLFGEGKMVQKQRGTIKAGQPLTIAGPGKDDTAWFVVLSVP
jgi:hypothetical protein